MVAAYSRPGRCGAASVAVAMCVAAGDWLVQPENISRRGMAAVRLPQHPTSAAAGCVRHVARATTAVTRQAGLNKHEGWEEGGAR